MNTYFWSVTSMSTLPDVPANVVAICNLTWTAEIIAAYQAQLEIKGT